MINKITSWGFGITLLIALGLFGYTQIQKHKLENANLTITQKQEQLEYLNEQVRTLDTQVLEESEKRKKLEELKNEAYKINEEAYRAFMDTKLFDDTKLLINKARNN